MITLWQVCLIEWFSGHNLLVTQWITLTLFCVPKRWVWSMACTAHPTRTRLSAKATSQSSCQVYPHMLPTFSTLIIISVSASYSYLKAPVGKRQSWEKGIIPPFRSDLKTFSQASTLLWHQLQTFAITHCDRGGSSQNSHLSQSQKAWKPWKSPCPVLPTSSGWQNSSAVCIKQLAKGFRNSLGQHVLLWRCGGQFCCVCARCEHCHRETPWKGTQVHCVRSGQHLCLWVNPAPKSATARGNWK